MDDAVVPSIRDALPQAVVLAAAFAGFLWAAALVRDRLRRGLPLVEPRPHPPVAWESGDVAGVVVAYLLGASLLAPAGTDPKPLFDRLADNVVLSLGTMLAAMSLAADLVDRGTDLEVAIRDALGMVYLQRVQPGPDRQAVRTALRTAGLA